MKVTNEALNNPKMLKLYSWEDLFKQRICQAKAYAFKCHRKEDMGSVIVYPVNTISYNSLTGNFVTGGSDSFVNLWDGENKKRIWKLKQYPSAIASLAFGGEGRHLAIACSYMYEEGDIPNQPPVKLFIKDL